MQTRHVQLMQKKIEDTKGAIRVITKLPNSEQSYKGNVKTHNYINRQNQSTTGKLQSETVYRRRTDTTMAKIKRTTNNLQNTTLILCYLHTSYSIRNSNIDIHIIKKKIYKIMKYIYAIFYKTAKCFPFYLYDPETIHLNLHCSAKTKMFKRIAKEMLSSPLAYI